MKNGNGKTPRFIHYMAMGAGFAAGAAVVSVFVTLASLGVREISQMIFAREAAQFPRSGNGQYIPPTQ